MGQVVTWLPILQELPALSFTFPALLLLFSHSVVSDSLRLHGLQHARLLCPPVSPRVHSNSCPLSQWHCLIISFSGAPFSSCLQSFPASGSFPMSQLCTWGGQNTGVSASASVLPKNTQDWSSLEWTGWISLQSKGLSRVFSSTRIQKHHYLALSLLYGLILTSVQWLLEKP